MDRIRKYTPLWETWNVKRKIGEGSFGAVYEVEKTVADHTSFSAVKLISIKNSEMLQGHKMDETMSVEELAMLKLENAKKSVREAALMDKLQGRDNIVTIYDYDIYPNEKTTDVLIRMELLRNLKDYLTEVRVDENLVINLGIDICKALEICEEEKIVHRDIKPENIFVNKDRHFKLGDFGLSRQMTKSVSLSLRKSKGTPLYMPPEALRWGDDDYVDHTSDIYSLALVMYQLLNRGKIPFCSDMSDYDEQYMAIGKRVNGKEQIPVPENCREELWDVIKKACSYEKKERYQSAAEMRKELTGLKTKLDAEKAADVLQSTQMQAVKTAGTYHVGETFTFGIFQQEKGAGAEKKPIEWQVLKKEAERILVISKYGLEPRPYSMEIKNGVWENSDIRKWLNHNFYEEAFNEEEKKKIRQTLVKARGNTGTGQNFGHDTKDKIFLLDIEEAEKLFLSEEERQCKPTEYAVKQRAYMNSYNGNCWWWLRSPVTNDGYTAIVNNNGFVSRNGVLLYDEHSVVRPAMWLDAKAPIHNKTASVQESQTIQALQDLKSINDYHIGDTFSFGRYRQNKSSSDALQPIEWRILKKEAGKILAISKYGLDAREYNKIYKNGAWENSALRKWLNQSFYETAFNEAEKARIAETLIKTTVNVKYGTSSGNHTRDKVFLLSSDEVESMFPAEKERECKPTLYARAQGVEVSPLEKTCCWWLRTPGFDSDYAACVVGCDGDISYGGDYLNNDNAVRPAIWIEFTS